MKLYPEGWLLQSKNEAERLLGLFFEANLPDAWAGFANYSFLSSDRARRTFGEWDFIILTPKANLFLIELKDNPKLFEDKGRLFALYKADEKPKDLSKQITDNFAAFVSNLKTSGLPPVKSRIFLISMRYKITGSLMLPSSSIFDPDSQPSAYAAAVLSMQTIEADSPISSFDFDGTKSRFFSAVGLVPSVDNISNQERSFVAKANGSYSLLKNLMISHGKNPHKLTIDAPPGSGKTQIGLAAIDEALQSGENVIYASHTRALAANIAAEFGKAEVINHSVWRAQTTEGTLLLTGSIYGLEDYIRSSTNHTKFSVVVIDEAHDIESQTINRFIQLTAASKHSRYLLLSDRAQGIFYENPESSLGSDTYSASYFLHGTYRCSQKITELLNNLALREKPIVCQNNIDGEVRLVVYPKLDDAYEFIRQCVDDFCEKGAHPSQFAVLVPTAQHVERALSVFPTSSSADSEGWRDKTVVDSVIRFKGYARDCVFIQCFFNDAREIDDHALRRFIYSCAGRAREVVVIVCDPKTEMQLAKYVPKYTNPQLIGYS